jgi:predicted RNA binding protein YcfA (HicA-like mRNA interferase family)
LKATNPEVRKLLAWAERHGWEIEQAKSGHYKLHHQATGARVTVAQTPSDHRSIPNTWREVFRAMGYRPPKPNAARYRQRRGRSGFSMDEAVAERDDRDAEAAEIHAEHERHRLELDALRARSLRLADAELDRAAYLVRSCLALEQRAERIGRPVEHPLRDYYL